MKIIVDAFGGDHAPLAVIEGCRQAVDELGAEILLTGDEEKIRQAAAEAKISLDGMEIVHAPSVIPVEEDPTTLLKKYADSSMAVGLRKPVIKAHGSSNAKAFKNAIRQAMTCHQNNMVGLIEEYMESYRAAEAAAKAEAAAGEEEAQ